MHYQQGGGKYPIHGEFCIKGRKIWRNAFVQESTLFMGSFASREEKLGEMHLFRGSLHSCIWELFFP
jgi:hypothetical protein